MRRREAVGALLLRRYEAEPFSPQQITLLQTFADQAVIAIENARLFQAEQASKRELQESLRQQIATAEVLKVMSRSPTNVQPAKLPTTPRSSRGSIRHTEGHPFQSH